MRRLKSILRLAVPGQYVVRNLGLSNSVGLTKKRAFAFAKRYKDKNRNPKIYYVGRYKDKLVRK